MSRTRPLECGAEYASDTDGRRCPAEVQVCEDAAEEFGGGGLYLVFASGQVPPV